MPRITREEKARNRANILEAAGRMFRTQGVDQVGIADLMKEAGLTHGGFYNHFPSKSALAAAASEEAFAASLGLLGAELETGTDASGTALSRVATGYLSARHRDDPDGGCPSASLVADAWRRGDDVQPVYVRGVEGYVTAFAEEISRRSAESGEPVAPEEARREALRMFSELVGAMTVARAVAKVAPELSDDILDASRTGLAPEPRAPRARPGAAHHHGGQDTEAGT